jgi:quinol-cytochrome oxidoreductase complex cytochrome b subunit
MLPPIAPQWSFAKRMYESLRNTPHEPTARAYLEATARLVMLSVAQSRPATCNS